MMKNAKSMALTMRYIEPGVDRNFIEQTNCQPEDYCLSNFLSSQNNCMVQSENTRQRLLYKIKILGQSNIRTTAMVPTRHSPAHQ